MSKLIDRTGQTYGRLSVLKKVGDKRTTNRQRTYWRCLCDCGTEVTVVSDSLVSGNTRSCGCLKRERIDRTGQVFGRLTIMKRAGRNKHGQTWWLCQCSCGNTTKVPTYNLTKGNTKSCGCLAEENGFGDSIDRTGGRYGRLTVINRAGVIRSQVHWLCHCDCGNETTVASYSLGSGETRSCGCLMRELAGNRARIHGLTGAKSHLIWMGAKQRAKDKGLPFNISPEFTAALFECTDMCPVCGINLAHSTNGHHTSISPSLDRLIPILGYTKSNVNVICYECNAMKRNGTVARLRQLADWMESQLRCTQ